MMTDSYPITTEVPMVFRRFGGKTIMVRPDGSRAVEQTEARLDNTLIKVIARGFRWERMLMSGAFATIEEMAEKEKISATYISRVMRLALLAPKIVETILEGRHPARLTMKDLLLPFPYDWDEQLDYFFGQRLG